MGYDSSRFPSEVDEELKCPICCLVLKDAVQSVACEHTFCSVCIHDWLVIQETCPVDRQPLTEDGLKPAPRVLRNFLAKLDIKCDFAQSGCDAIVKLDSLSAHCNECEFNPYKPIACSKGCGLVLLRNQVDEHNCLADLRSLIANQQKEIDALKCAKKSQSDLIQALRDDLKRFREHAYDEQQRQIRSLQQSIARIEDRIDDKRKCTWKETQCSKKISSPHSQRSSTTTGSSVSTAAVLQQQLVTFYGSIITLNVEPEDTIDSVKQQIAIREDVEFEQLLLFYAGQQLEDDKTLSYYDIHNNNDRRHLVLRLKDGMKILVRTMEEKLIQVKVDPNDTIEIIKVKIHELEGISPCDQRLKLNGNDLPDLRTIADYGLKHNTILQLDLHLGGPCPICQTQFKNSPLPSTSS